jgi:hypothetical protein
VTSSSSHVKRLDLEFFLIGIISQILFKKRKKIPAVCTCAYVATAPDAYRCPGGLCRFRIRIGVELALLERFWRADDGSSQQQVAGNEAGGSRDQNLILKNQKDNKAICRVVSARMKLVHTSQTQRGKKATRREAKKGRAQQHHHRIKRRREFR